MKRASTRAAKAGFTLIELMAVMVIIGILSVALVTGVQMYLHRAGITACQANLREIQQMLVSLRAKGSTKAVSGPPREGGVALFYELWMKSDREQTMKNAKRFVCPSTEIVDLEGWKDDYDQISDDPRTIWGDRRKGWRNDQNQEILNAIRANGRDYSSYRAINLKKLKLGWQQILSGHTPIVADGNPKLDDDFGSVEATCNHDTETCVGYGDGNTETLEPDDIDELAGLEGVERLRIVGPLAPQAQKGSRFELFRYLVFNADEND